ncbi:MAG TPA: phosphoglycerate kinase, partial [Thermoplasmatales archaeon]|nr:phosphoglycerate kinase [Thermoplasmatales archaeon]
LMLPADVAIDDGGRREVSVDDLDAGQAGRIRDIGAAAIEDFSTAIGEAGSVLMSGPLGVFEEENFARGTREVMQAIARSRAFSVLGGGHTVAAAQAFGVADEVSYVSTGGGSLERFLMGQRLPVIAALEDYGSRKH